MGQSIILGEVTKNLCTVLSDEVRGCGFPSQMIQIHCAKTVPESNVFNPFELTLSEKQIPRLVGNVSSYKKWTELLESRGVRPRQARS